jgi:hypothetical protein
VSGYLLYRDSTGTINRTCSPLIDRVLLVNELERQVPLTSVAVLGIVLLPAEQPTPPPPTSTL